jgi:hypothetical protein
MLVALPLSFGQLGQGSMTWKCINGRTHHCLLQGRAHWCCCLSLPLSYGWDNADGGRGEGNGDCAGGNQRGLWSRSLFFCTTEVGKLDKKACQWSHPLSSPETGARCHCCLSPIAPSFYCAPSFFWTEGVGNPDVEVHQWSHPLSSLAMGGTLLLLSLPAIIVRL